MTANRERESARFFQALGDPTRLALIEELRAGERNVNELVRALACPQPKVSRHLKVLKDAGLVRDQRTGRHVAYTLTTSRQWPKEARAWIATLGEGLPLAGSKRARPATPAPAAAPSPPETKRVIEPRKPESARRNLDPHLL